MSGICDTCQRLKRIGCGQAMDNLKSCDMYEHESNYDKLFSTPEKAARAIANACQYHGCFDCSYGCLADGAVCGCGDYDTLLEWLSTRELGIED